MRLLFPVSNELDSRGIESYLPNVSVKGKEEMMKKIFVTVCVFILISGCAKRQGLSIPSEDINQEKAQQLREFMEKNQNMISTLTLGMTKQEVLRALGSEQLTIDSLTITNPYRSQYIKDNKEVIFYYTQVKKKDKKVGDDELTPLIFENGILIGIGNECLEELKSTCEQ